MVPREGHPHLWSRVRAPPHAILALHLDVTSNDFPVPTWAHYHAILINVPYEVIRNCRTQILHRRVRPVRYWSGEADVRYRLLPTEQRKASSPHRPMGHWHCTRRHPARTGISHTTEKCNAKKTLLDGA